MLFYQRVGELSVNLWHCQVTTGATSQKIWFTTWSLGRNTAVVGYMQKWLGIKPLLVTSTCGEDLNIYVNIL